MTRYFAFHRKFYNGHPRNVTLGVRRVVVRAVNHGLVVTSTTDGGHAPTSYHYTKPLGRAVDLGTTSPTTASRKAAFQRWLLHTFGARAFLELFGPDNKACVKNGVQFTMVEGSALETLHDTHVHVVPARTLPLPKRRKKKAVRSKAAKRVSAKGVQFIARFEGFRSTAYKPDPKETYYTIGYGHYGRDVKKGQKISRARALVLLAKDVKSASDAVRKSFPHLNQNQHDAITSAVFNLGPGILDTRRSLGAALKAHKGVGAALALYVHGASGTKLEGLVIRRAAEAALYNKRTR